MPFPLHLALVLFSISCKAEVTQTYFTGFENKTTLTDENSTSGIWGLTWPDSNISSSFNIVTQPANKNVNTLQSMSKGNSESTTIRTMQTMATNSTKRTTNLTPYSTTKKPFWYTSQHGSTNFTNTSPSTPCVCKDDRYKTGIMICAIIIAVLVLICAILIICTVALTNKVSTLKSKLRQSKRQARSNGDFLSASSILWPSGMETWQKKPQTVADTMDDISLGETNSIDEKHKLMTLPTTHELKDTNAENKITSPNDHVMTVVSTVEV